ncbi:Panacea domain-containing protein [Aggregatibacter actinomycetemcomitans]|uniref:Panacea domain-containing protein n=1 Tax=Aggregatibacter actinomycetemcomitans TaxID=714 RepID=UPI00022AC33A|nr:type II toxin-antitoxin system antitoxin SocA domain-containing protein [Aggregatibacter actinomycetemcomitans]AHN71872.1 hypothetical protein CF65_01533 [Aggregatibacter actinomycetemcomitans HK1651]KND84063.1 hypothetical protein SCC1398_0203270 [Aggregatibacter actinomycetemcomitans serotype b str. SCC1398]KOE51916.1 hypothetical protein SCC4092_0209545 [Aggregatibacter actinomycetemcomitans serotype b str. SCC4092]QPQ80813.1 DUF4065 domain-containing protein [Aggregatibacter actinomycete
MGYSSIAIANSFIGKANIGEISNLTPMKLQKLMFYTQSWYIKLYGKPLFEGGFERWQFGPVLPEIYHEFKPFGSRIISSFGTDIWGKQQIIKESDKDTLLFLDKIIEIYGKFDGPQLSWMTHQPETAWSMGRLGSVITQDELFNGKV